MEETDNIIEVDFGSIFRKLLGHWKLIVSISFCAAVLGIILSFGVPREYTVVSKVAPELSLRTNSLTSLASMAGLNMNLLSNNNDALLPTVYPEIVGSVPFVTELFTMPVADSTLYDYMLKGTRSSWPAAILSLPGKAVHGIVSLFKPDEEDSEDSPVDVFHLTREQAAVYKSLSNSISVDVDKKTFLVSIVVKMQNPEIAADLSRCVIDNMQKYVTTYRTSKAQKNADFLAATFEEVRAEYFTAQQRYAAYNDSHQEIFSQRAQLEKQRLQNEMNLKYQMFSSIAQQLQQAKVTVQQETPVFAEVVPPTVPLRKTSPKRMRMAVLFAFLGCLASCIHVLTKK